MHIADKMLVMA